MSYNDDKLRDARQSMKQAVKDLREVVDAHEDDREFRDDFIRALDQMAVDLGVMVRRLDRYR